MTEKQKSKEETLAYDRIIMPLPKDAELFLEDALIVANKGTRIHLYQFGREDEVPRLKKNIHAIIKKTTRKLRIQKVIKAGEYSPRVYRLCFDMIVTK